MSFSEQVYERLPVLLQNVAVTLAGYRRNRERFGRTYRSHRVWLREFDLLDGKAKSDYQAASLREFVEFAREKSEFYRETLPPVTTGPDVDEYLRQLPVLEKESLRTRIADIVTVDRRHAIEGHTGGTTGKSLVVRFTIDDNMRRMAMLDHFKWRVARFEHRKMRRASFTGRHLVPPRQPDGPFWRYNHASRQMLFSSFHVTETTAPGYIEALNRFRPHAIDGFPTPLADLASYILRNNLVLAFAPMAIFPTSETVTARVRNLVESAFRAPVFDQYASSEGAPFITECGLGRLHIEQSTGVFEMDAAGDTLVTSFDTHGTPLIRYRIGDAILLEPPTVQCECGLTGSLARSIEGRSQDYLVRADGARINGGNAANLFKNMPNALISAQLVQERLGEVRALLVVDAAIYRDEHDELLREEFVRKFGITTDLVIEHVSEIAREPSGKHSLIKNTMARAAP